VRGVGRELRGAGCGVKPKKDKKFLDF
jgi:hypothetical protein